MVNSEIHILNHKTKTTYTTIKQKKVKVKANTLTSANKFLT